MYEFFLSIDQCVANGQTMSLFIVKDDAREVISNFLISSAMLYLLVIRKFSIQRIIAPSFLSSRNPSMHNVPKWSDTL